MLFSVCSCGNKSEKTNIPDEVTGIYEKYMALLQTGTNAAFDYNSYDESIRESFIGGGNLLDYYVASWEKINDRLYNVTSLTEMETYFLPVLSLAKPNAM
ncbi:MAG: hypothetical protein WCQ72_01085 [Eubacteriales bacterium]